MIIDVRPMSSKDYLEIREVDISTQKQYLKKQWKIFSAEERKRHLITCGKMFNMYSTSGFSLVATVDKKIVGFLLAYQSNFKEVFIKCIAVKPDMQHKGIGTKLLVYLEKLSKKKDIIEIISFINIDNPVSLHLHEKLRYKFEIRIEAKKKLIDCSYI